MVKALPYILLVTGGLFLSYGKPQDPVTQEFRSYLATNFGLEAENDKVYCLMPPNQCRYCVNYDVKFLPANLKDRFIMISSFPKSDYRGFPTVYYDKQSVMMGLHLLDYNKKLIVYKNNKISSIISISDFYQQLDSLSIALP